MTKYAEKTSVSVAKTKTDIESMVTKYGADQYICASTCNKSMICFRLKGKQIKFFIELPDKNSNEFLYTPERKNRRNEEAALAAWEQACRQKWRALYLVIKAKLEAVESGITCMECEFMANIVLPDGKTVGQHIIGQIEDAYNSGQMPSLLLDVE